MEELTEAELDEFEAGFYAAERGDDLPINSTPAYIDGFAFFKFSRLRRKRLDAKCRAH